MAPEKTTNDPVFLLEALKQNWEHARHQEVQRQHQMYVFMIVLGATLTFIFDGFIDWFKTLSQFWVVFLFLAIFSWYVSYNLTKWSLEFQNHIANIQWISDKMKLIIPQSKTRENAIDGAKIEINNAELTSKEKNQLKKDAYFQGIMGLPLPLQKRVNQNFDTLAVYIFGGTFWAFISGLLIACIDILPFFSISLPFDKIILQVLSICIGFGIMLFAVRKNLKTRNQMKDYKKFLVDAREPSLDLNVKYGLEDSFFVKIEKPEDSS